MSDTPEHEKPVAFKITHGFVRQDFVDGKCVRQKFVDGPVDWEDEVGNPLNFADHQEEYYPFDMKQPNVVVSVKYNDFYNLEPLTQLLTKLKDQMTVDLSVCVTLMNEREDIESSARKQLVAVLEQAGIPFEVQNE